MNVLSDRPFLAATGFWAIVTGGFFVLVANGAPVSPIAEDAFMSILTIYLPVLVLAVFLLLHLTRSREPVAWADLFAVDKTTARREAWLAVGYLLITQSVLGFVFNMGLHFPGPDVYTTGSHAQADVWMWVITYTVVYTLLPLLWLRQRGFSFRKLFSSFRWRRDLSIIVAYWALDFFGPIITGAADFLGGISASQYAQGVPWGMFINTFGAGLPVLVMMHVILIPRLAVLVRNKITVILLGGLFYAIFSLFDPGVDYSSWGIALTSVSYIVMTQALVGMGKAAFTVVTGNPFIHFITLHIVSARVPFDTRMYIEIFNLR